MMTLKGAVLRRKTGGYTLWVESDDFEESADSRADLEKLRELAEELRQHGIEVEDNVK